MHQSRQNLVYDGQVVASAEDRVGEEINRLSGRGRGGRGGAALPRRDLPALGQRNVIHVDLNSEELLHASFARGP